MAEEASPLDRLLAEFPEPNGNVHSLEQRIRLLEWILKVFVLWHNGENQEVTERRDEVAVKVGTAYDILPEPGIGLAVPNLTPRDPHLVEWLLTFALNTLITSNNDQRSVCAWFFVSPATACLGS